MTRQATKPERNRSGFLFHGVAVYLHTGAKSTQYPCATIQTMPMLEPGWLICVVKKAESAKP
jgi:hypothetical protein